MATPVQKSTSHSASLSRSPDGTTVVHVGGEWRLGHNALDTADVFKELSRPPKSQRIVFEAAGLGYWDSSLLTFVETISEMARKGGTELELAGLPAGAQRLLNLAAAVPEKEGARGTEERRQSILERVGNTTIGITRDVGEFLDFLGRVTVAFLQLLRGKARFRTSDLMIAIQECGAGALGIVSLISYLVGVILAFMGAVQLQQFGAQIYVADLVAIGVTRDMGAMMTAIIMAGRTGAAFAAALGTMKVTQEIDALSTMGISPLEFLVMPRVIALVVMMPLLCLYSDFVAILGGTTIGVGMLGIGFGAFLREAAHAITMTDVIGGLAKGTTYGALIAISGCLKGFQCGNSSSAVGDAATQAVVLSIVLIVTSCGVFAVVFNFLGI